MFRDQNQVFGYETSSDVERYRINSSAKYTCENKVLQIKNSAAKKLAGEILSYAGIDINGSRPWDIQVHDETFYRRVVGDGSLGLGTAYEDGLWDCEQLDEFFARLIPSQPEDKIRKNWKLLLRVIAESFWNKCRKARAFEVAERHYDIGNDLFSSMLDNRMVYSCAYWKETDNLHDAQEAKLELICRKLGLRRGDRVLDIGCGWGSFAQYAAEKYGARVVGITVSREQARLAAERCSGLPVEIRLQDYRDLNETFHHVVSVGMFEHVGRKNYRTYMEVAHRCLRDDGLFLLHTIGNKRSYLTTDAWTEKYIFPNSFVPSMKQISASLEEFFIVEDWHNFGADYDKTLTAWFVNFDKAWKSLKNKYGERFYRLWKYYLLSSAGAFRSRDLQVWQVVLSKNGVPGGYSSVR